MPDAVVTMERTAEPNGFLTLMQSFTFVWGFMLIVLVPISLITMGTGLTLLWAEGVAGYLILFTPVLFRREYDVFEPISFVMLTTTLGFTLRAVYIAFFTNDNINRELLLGHTKAFLVPGGALCLIGLVALVAGYATSFPAINVGKFSFIRNDLWRTKRLYFIALLFTLVSFGSIVLYVKTLGIGTFVLSTLSEKHQYVVENAMYKYSSLGYYRWGASLVVPAFYMYLVWFGESKKRLFYPSGILVILMGLLSLVFPFINSSRSDVISILIITLIIWHYRRKQLLLKKLVLAMVVCIMLIMVMTALRKHDINVNQASSESSSEKIMQTLVGSRNFFGIDKMAHVLDAVPGRLEYCNGWTFLTWIVAPVPRTMWLEKPVIQIGSIIGRDLYKTKDMSGKGAGIPPGFVAELYWNFGLLAVPVGMFMLGCFLKVFYKSFLPLLRNNKNALLIYVSIIMSPALDLLGNSISSCMIGLLLQTIPAVLALYFVGKRRPIEV